MDISVILILFAGRFIANKALQPVADMVDKVEEITATNLDHRISEGSGKDEIAELAVTFNAMLDRLEKSFDAQKEFVSNISHELRTPLTAMLAELQLTVSNERNNEEYKNSKYQAPKSNCKNSPLIPPYKGGILSQAGTPVPPGMKKSAVKRPRPEIASWLLLF